MCGIAGLVHTDPKRPLDAGLFRRITDTLIHRGPDASGYFFDDGAALGSRRLSIIDLVGGDQPIFNENGTKVVILNGEIYNFRELRAELTARGHRFSTASDTEVIVHAWEEHGDACVSRLRGMFALALWDRRRRRLLLARDRIGKKPLYYAHDHGRLLFASELKALLLEPSIKRILSAEAIDDYLAFGAVPAPRTIWSGVEQLPPAHYLVWEDGSLRVSEYWDIVPRVEGEQREDDYLEEFAALLDEAVRLRMISDVPLGAFLSGGIDSTAVVASMAAQSSQAVVTTSVGVTDHRLNELPHAREIARAFGTDHHEIIVDPADVEALPTLVWHLDEPFADSSAVPTYYVSRAARERVTVALSGDGGDELFAGYAWRYGLNLVEDRLRRRLPGWFRRGVVRAASEAWPKADHLPRALRWKYLLRNVSLTPEEAYFRDMSVFPPGDKRRLLAEDFRSVLGDHDPFDEFNRHFRKVAGLDHLSRILYVDAKTYLPNDILVKVDRMSMAHSLEVRSPLLDHRIIEFAATVPSRLKFRGTTSKYLLRRHVATRAPAPVSRRPKRGFSIPIASWLRHGLRDMAYDLLFAPQAVGRGYFSPGHVRQLWDAHQERRRDHSQQLWALIALELWHRLFVDQSPSAWGPPKRS